MSTYEQYHPTQHPAPFRGPWGERYTSSIGALKDDAVSRAKDGVKARLVASAPVDALIYLGADRLMVRYSADTDESYRARVLKAWEIWRQSTRRPGITRPLVLLGLHGVSVVTNAENPIDGSALWARFRVFVSGLVVEGEPIPPGEMLGNDHPDGAGLGIAPLLVGEFNVGQWVVGVTATPSTVASIRASIRTWKGARDQCAAVVFTWGSGAAPEVSLRGNPSFDGGVMSKTLTPNAEYDDVAVIIAENGEVWSDADGPAPFEIVFQKLVDRVAFARDTAIGGLDWNGEISCVGGTNADFDITVGPINTIVCVTSGGTYYVLASSGATVTESAIEGGGVLAGDSCYCLYAYRSGGGSLAYELSLTAPSASRRFKTGDTTRRYLGCFLTNGAGAPLAFEAVRGRYTFRRSAISNPNTTLRRLTRTSTGTATLNLVPRVPAHARKALLRATVALGAATVAALSLGTASGDAGYAEVLDAVSGGLARLSTVLPLHHASSSDASIFYDFSHDNVSDSTTVAEIIVDGWVE